MTGSTTITPCRDGSSERSSRRDSRGRGGKFQSLLNKGKEKRTDLGAVVDCRESRVVRKLTHDRTLSGTGLVTGSLNWETQKDTIERSLLYRVQNLKNGGRSYVQESLVDDLRVVLTVKQVTSGRL